MRASSLALVVLTSLYSQLLVGATNPPTNFSLVPPHLTSNESNTISWDESNDVFIAAIYLVQDLSSGQPLQTVQPILNPLILCIATSCTTQLAKISTTTFIFAPSISLNPTKPVMFEVSYTTASAITFITQLPTVLSNPYTTVGPAENNVGTGQISSRPAIGANGPTGSQSMGSDTSSPTATGAVPATFSSSPNISSDEGSGGLSTGAKVGIAIGAVGAALLIIIVVLLLWRRSRQRKLKALPGGTMAYNDDRGSSMNRDLTAEKDMQILNSQVGVYAAHETGHGPAYTSSHSHEPQHLPQEDSQSPVASWPHNEQRGSYDEMFEGSQIPPQAPTPPAVAGASSGSAAASASTTAPGVSRKAVAGPAKLFHEPGMSDDEVARLEEEERRIDEAIAEAERRRKEPAA